MTFLVVQDLYFLVRINFKDKDTAHLKDFELISVYFNPELM